MSSLITILITLSVLKSVVLLTNVTDGRRIRRARTRHDSYVNASIDNIFSRPDSARRPCETEQIEYRLTRLEVQVAEKSENVRSELHENNRRLQTLDFQSRELQTTLERFRNEVAKVGVINPSNQAMSKFETRLEQIGRGVDLLVLAIKNINVDIMNIKKSVSSLAASTQDLLWMQEESEHPRRIAVRSYINNEQTLPRNCREVQDKGNNISGIYSIQPKRDSTGGDGVFLVLCDMTTRGGGWTFIHNRYDGMQDFYLNWQSYKHGFGNLGGEFWIGLEYLHQLTGTEVNELLVELVDQDFNKAYAHYSAFSIGSELEGYPLKILGGYSGDAGDSLIYHAGSKFSTHDKDQDTWDEGNCAQAHHGAWWYKGCDTCNLNGKYLNGELSDDYLYQGMYWGGFKGPRYSLAGARMMVRPRYENSRDPMVFANNNDDRNSKN